VIKADVAARASRGPVPGRLRCERYAVGGPGIACSDSNGSNSGSGALNPLDGSCPSSFRAGEAVDISHTKDVGATTQDFSAFNRVVPDRDALHLGWTEPGELRARYPGPGLAFVGGVEGIDCARPLLGGFHD
jgi:hypothetical protein